MIRLSLALEGTAVSSPTVGVCGREEPGLEGLAELLSGLPVSLMSSPWRQHSWNSRMITLLPFTFPCSSGSNWIKTGGEMRGHGGCQDTGKNAIKSTLHMFPEPVTKVKRHSQFQLTFEGQIQDTRTCSRRDSVKPKPHKAICSDKLSRLTLCTCFSLVTATVLSF